MNRQNSAFSVNLHLSKKVSQHSRIIPLESYLDLKQAIKSLRHNGSLPEEISLPGDCLFAFAIDGDWVAIAQRQECRNWRGSRALDIEVFDLLPKSEFDLSSNRKTSEPASGGTDWPAKVSSAIAPLIHHPHLTIRVGVVVTSAIGLFAVAYQSQGEVKLKMETDGDRVTNEVTIDNRQSQ